MTTTRSLTRPARQPSQATTALVTDNLGLVRALARRMMRTEGARYLEFDDLVAIGTEALFDSARRFDPDAGARFSTFAFTRVRGAMIDGMARMAPLPRGAYRCARRRVAEGKTGLFMTSLDAEGAPELAQPADRPTADVVLDQARLAARLPAALARLPARKRRFIERHYFAGQDLQSIGRELGLSKSWASRLHGQAIAELRVALGA